MRTNIDIDDELMEEALELTGLTTKRAVVEEALRMLIQLRQQAKIGELYGKLRWEGDLSVMREDRFDYPD
jgi:Arc/MetJ family transcription regulator